VQLLGVTGAQGVQRQILGRFSGLGLLRRLWLVLLLLLVIVRMLLLVLDGLRDWHAQWRCFGILLYAARLRLLML
jgi:hypothetical protein